LGKAKKKRQWRRRRNIDGTEVLEILKIYALENTSGGRFKSSFAGANLLLLSA
jgi:hypothetical protein